ncbi:MAG TPA: hypothetical protein VI542_26630 [Candidatus Tectomicrobia bacterium]
MIDTLEQFEQAEEAILKMKRFLLAVRRTHTPEAYIALSAPILRELQERERDILIYLSRSPEVVTGHQG